MELTTLTFDLQHLRAAYAAGASVRDVIGEAQRRCAGDDLNAFIYRLTAAELEPYLARLERLAPNSLPLYGVPFAVKDNIDVAGVPTTAACPEYAYTPTADATVVAALIDAGAVPLGKTNLDQFATGLNGTRSPYGPGRNAFDPEYISGGSSSGSALATAKGWVAFALGTDTAGSGRVPAALNNLIGLKPTCGLLSTTGVVPACRSLDTVSIFTLTAADAAEVLDAAARFDAMDPYSRPAAPFGVDFSGGPFRFGVPRAEDLEFFGNRSAQTLFAQTVARMSALGGEPVTIDLTPFIEAAKLLYDGPWVAERYLAIRDFIATDADAVFPPVRAIIAGGDTKTAADAFAASYRLKAYKRLCDAALAGVDCLLIPTAGTTYTIAAMQADPITLNSNLGRYTNFVNLLDYCAVAAPAGFLSADEMDGLPWGVTLVAPAHRDVPLLRLADRLQRRLADELSGYRIGATAAPLPAAGFAPLKQLQSGTVEVAVCGAHLTGLPLNHQLTSRGARRTMATQSSADYKLYALPGGPVERPGMVRVASGGAAIDVEVWELPATEFGSFVAGIPAPLGIGKVKLADGRLVPGFVCEQIAIDADCLDITAHGGWRQWLAAR